jgi:hypothetical protein
MEITILLLVVSRVVSQKQFTWCNRDICTFILSFTPVFGPPFTPLTPLLVVSIKSRYEMLKFSTKCSISALNAQGSRGIIVAVHVGAVKIYVAAVEGRRSQKKKDKVKLRMSFTPP